MKRAPVIAVAYLAAYLLLEWLCFTRPVLVPEITPWHPQAGLTVAFLVAVGPEWAVMTFIAALAAQLGIRDVEAPLAASVAGAVVIALVSAALGAALRRLLGSRDLGNSADTARFAALASAAGITAAFGYVGVFFAFGELDTTDALRGIARYGLAEVNGMLMVTPLLLAIAARPVFVRLRPRELAELLAPFVLVLAIVAVIFSLPAGEQMRFLYLLFFPVIWIALRWDWRGALPAVLLVQAGLIYAAEAELRRPRFIDTQVLLATLTLTALLLGSVVAERRRSEQRLRERDAELSRAMRFAVAGELASATTHELNQPMTALVSYLNAAEILARSPGADDDRLRATVRKAAAEALRASDVLHRLRNFYIGGRSRRERVPVAALLGSVGAAFADRLRRADVTLDVMADPALPDVEGDETQLQIVLHNLLANAIDAAQTGAADKRVDLRATRDGDRVIIVVEDSGSGIDPGVAETLFEPFTTNKTDGMGLGLAISRTLVRAAQGELSAATGTKLRGARLVLSLPVSKPMDDA